MKLASFEYQGASGIGVVDAERASVTPLNPWLDRRWGLGPRCTMLDLIEHDPVAWQKLAAEGWADAPQLPLAQVQLKPPVRRPSKVICLALNNSANSDRILKGPAHPAFFTKPASARSADEELGGHWSPPEDGEPLVKARGYNQPGDIVESEIERIGTLRVHVGPARG